MSAIAFNAAAVLAAHRAKKATAKVANAANPELSLSRLATLAGDAVSASHGVEGHSTDGRSADLPVLRAHATNAAEAGTALAEMDAWHAGVSRLATMRCPSGIEPRRWAIYRETAARLRAQHGAALHAAGWGTLELFGLHPCAPVGFPPGWGLAWLLEETGDVLDVHADAVGICRVQDGARLVFRRRVWVSGVLAAWELGLKGR